MWKSSFFFTHSSHSNSTFFRFVWMAWTIETSEEKKANSQWTGAIHIWAVSEKCSSPTGFERHRIQIKLQAIKIRTRNAILSAANCGRKGRRRWTSENSTETDACNPNYDEKQKFRKIVFSLSVSGAPLVVSLSAVRNWIIKASKVFHFSEHGKLNCVCFCVKYTG